MAEELHLALLGNVAIRRAGIPITGFSSSKTQALLFYLATTGRSHARPSLAGLLWGDLPETNARNNLRKALANLRQLVGSHLNITRQAVAFSRDSPYQLDVELFEARVADASAEVDIEALQEAVKLYRGDFLEGFYVRQAPAFEEWVLAQRARLRELVLQALHTLAVHHTRRGEAGHADGIDYTTRLLALEPWREEAHRQLMLLLARSGQRGAALAQYETCRQILTEELGVEPGAETTALYERIRDGEVSRDTGEQRSEGEVLSSVPLLSRTPASPPFFSSAPHPPRSAILFVAREPQLAQLNSFLDSVLAGQGRVVFVTGEAGSGKTALVQEFTRQAQERESNLIVADGSCNAYTGVGDPYLPFREILELLMGNVEASWAAGAISRNHAYRLWNLMPQSVRVLLNTGPDLVDVFIRGRSLMTRATAAVPNGVDWLTQLRELVTQKEAGRGRADLKQSDLFEQYTKVLQGLALETPLLLALDDLQWADAGSINLLFHLGRRLQGSPILIIGIYRQTDVALGRDGSRHPLEGVVNEFQRHFGQIHINLQQAEDRRFVEALLDTEPNRLGPSFREAFYRQTKGHALFTAEMLKGLQERGDLAQDKAGLWIESATIDWQTLPARVEGIISERINRLPMQLQETLKVASVEGETFTAEVVAQVRTMGEPEMVRQLSSELDKQHRLVRSQGSQVLEPSRQRLSYYQFRHILFQKYLYDSLDNVERVYLHEDVGQLLERLHREHTEEVALQLAWHFQVAGFKTKAINYLREAGERAVRLSANEAAIDHLTRALALLNTLPDTPDRTRQELELQTTLGSVLMASKGYAAAEVEQAFTRALELCRQMGGPPQLFSILSGLWNCYFVRAEFQHAYELAEQLLRESRNVPGSDLLLEAHFAMGATLFFLGKLVSAREQLELGIAFYHSRQHQTLTSLLGQDPGLYSLTYVSHTVWLLGYPDQAQKRCNEALNLAYELDQPYSLALTLCLGAVTHFLCREEQTTQELAEAAISLSTKQGFAQWIAHGIFLRNWAQIRQGQGGEKEIAQMRQAMDAWRATGAELARPVYLLQTAETLGDAGQAEEALSLLDEALAVAHRTEECWLEAELYRLTGELQLRQAADAVQIEQHFQKALKIARQQSAKSLELRAVMSLSGLWRKQGKKEEARQMLAEIYDWFTEGFDTLDLKEAKALLDELS